MNFHKSLYLSFGIHALLLGTALAFARYGDGLLEPRLDFISVTLVDGGERSDSNTHATVKPVLQAPAPRQERIVEEATTVIFAPRDVNGGEQQDAETEGSQESNSSEKVSSNQVSAGRAGLPEPEERRMIREAIERAKRYPRLARERGIQGVVHVRFKLRPSGDVEQVEVLGSSGHDVLDAASVKTVYRASPMPYVNGWLEVPMAYVLK